MIEQHDNFPALVVGHIRLRRLWLAYNIGAHRTVQPSEVELQSVLAYRAPGTALFADPTVTVVESDLLSKRPLTELLTHVSVVDRLVASLPELPAKLPGIDPDVLRPVVTVAVPTTTRGWQELAAGFGLSIGADTCRELQRQATLEEDAACNTFEIMVRSRVTDPELLTAVGLNSSGPGSAPWTVGDLVERGAVSDAVRLSSSVPGMVLHAYLSRRWTRALQLAEGAELEDRRDSQLSALCRKSGEAVLREALRVLAAHDALVKTAPVPGAELLVYRLTELFARHAPRSVSR